jgi:hypothetical protein
MGNKSETLEMLELIIHASRNANNLRVLLGSAVFD